MAATVFDPSDAGHAQVAEINIIPLADVLLVLLIIFMVTAPKMTRAIELDLPQAGKSRPAPDRALALRIDAAGDLALGDRALALPGLQAALAEEAGRDPSMPVRLQLDVAGDADYGLVAKALAASRNAGIDRIEFVRR